MIDIMPLPILHMSLLELFKAALPQMKTVGEPGIQGEGQTGVHGTGEPSAATTAGLAGELHVAKGSIILSIIVAAKGPWAKTVF